MVTKKRCAYVNDVGERCRLGAIKGTDYCKKHPPKGDKAESPRPPNDPKSPKGFWGWVGVALTADRLATFGGKVLKTLEEIFTGPGGPPSGPEFPEWPNFQGGITPEQRKVLSQLAVARKKTDRERLAHELLASLDERQRFLMAIAIASVLAATQLLGKRAVSRRGT